MRTDTAIADLIVAEFRDTVPDETLLRLIHDVASKRMRRVTEMSEHAGISARSLSRMFERCSLPEPSQWIQLISILRVLVQVLELPDGHRPPSLRVASKAAGYTNQFTFSQQMYRATKLRPSAAVKDRMTLKDVIWCWKRAQTKRGTTRV